MIGDSSILIAVILASMALVGYLVIRPSVTATRGGKILAFVSLLVFPTLAGSLGAVEHLEHSKSTAFCLSCHVMQDYGRSLRIDDRSYLPAVHFQNNLVPRDQACYTCHTNYTMYGDLRSKLRGLNHVYVQYLGRIPSPLKLYQPYHNRECLHCHLGARSFEEGAAHTQDPKTLPMIKANQLSCSSTDCHNFVHRVDRLNESKFWKDGNP